jgi:hypothetical protein
VSEEAAKREMAIIESVLIEWVAVDSDYGSVVVCYDLNISYGLSLILIMCI